MDAYERLEKEFGEWIGNPNTVACNSGTAALHLALEALELRPESRVIVPEFTMVACARAVTMAGLEPVFVDCDDTMLLDPVLVERRAAQRIKAIMPVHIYGRRCNMTAIHATARYYDCRVVEDLAEAHGVRPHKDTDAACWSFYRNKIVAGEEGGMIAFKNPHHAKLAKKLRSQGFTAAHDFSHVPRGCNYRLANALASIILGSLHNVNENLRRRTRIEAAYNRAIPEQYRLPKREACWVYDLRVPGMNAAQQSQIIANLNAAGVAARHAFKPMSSQQEYRKPHFHLKANLFAREVFYLPADPTITEQQAAAIATMAAREIAAAVPSRTDATAA
ncbi:MAG: aminotransferase class I/II-fold pyridoxal phosphate-dependent enzyme [Opitutaceae bacterium]